MNRLTALLLIFTILLTGCGQLLPEEVAEAIPTEVTTSETATLELNSQEATTGMGLDLDPEVTTPVSGGTLNISMSKPVTLNPLLNEDIRVDGVLRLIFEPLFTIDEGQNIVPNLAEAYLPADDGRSVAVSLRPDAKWSDGTAVTAEDLIFSLDTIAAAPAGSIYKRAMANVSDYYQTSSTTVVIEYSAPFGGCMYNLCFPLIPAHYYSGYNTWDSARSMQPLGNGMYTFDSYRVVRYMDLSASQTCFRGTPYIDKIHVIVIDDKETEISSFEQGLIDVLAVSPEEYGTFNSQNSINVTPYSSNRFEFLGFNFKNSALSNKNIRQAVAYAMPMDNIIDNIYLGNAVKSLTPVNPGSVLNGDGMEDYDYDHDLSMARQLVKDTGLTAEQLTFTILVNENNSERCEIAELIASELNQIGMNVTVYKTSFADYVKLLQTDSFTMFIGGMEFNTGVDLRTMLLSSSQSNGSNYFNFSDLQMDNLLNACASASGDEAYRAAITQVQRYCAAQLPCVGICFKSQLLLTDGSVKGDKNPVIGDIYRNIVNWYISD